MKQHCIWAVEVQVFNWSLKPHFIYLLRENARNKASELRKQKVVCKVVKYVPFIPLKAEFTNFALAIAKEVNAKSTRQSPQAGSGSTASSWPSYQRQDVAEQA